MKDRRNAWEKDCYRSKERSSSPAAHLETNKSKSSPPRARPSNTDSCFRKSDQSAAEHVKREREDSSDTYRSKKHKKSKKKKKSKDKERHHESR